MPSKLIDPAELPTMTFDLGLIKPLVSEHNVSDPGVSLMHVVLLPGRGHERLDDPPVEGHGGEGGWVNQLRCHGSAP